MQPDWAEHAVSIVVIAGLIIGGIATVAAGLARQATMTKRDDFNKRRPPHMDASIRRHRQHQ